MRKLVVLSLLAAVVGVLFLVVPSVGGADPNLVNVGRHSHWLVTGSGANLTYLSEVGPDFCHDPNLQNAFNQFHNNVHTAGSSAIGPAAPGLRNGKGADIVSRPCDFVPPS
jgi:hypothetical protein